MFKLHDKPESPNEGACLRKTMNQNRQMRLRMVSLGIVDCPFLIELLGVKGPTST